MLRKGGAKLGSTGSVVSGGARAWVLSGIVHASLAAAVIAHGVPPRASESKQLIDVELAVMDLPPPPPEEHVDVPAPQPVLPRPSEPPIARPVVSQAAPTHAALAQHTSTLETSAPDSAPVVAAADGPPTFVMALPIASVAGSAAPEHAANEVVDEKGVSVRAEVAYGPAPVYPTEAREAQIEVDVPIEIVVNPDGQVVLARVTRHIGYGFEESAIDSIRRYRFKPAQRDGRPVAVRMLWTMQYRLR